MSKQPIHACIWGSALFWATQRMRPLPAQEPRDDGNGVLLFCLCQVGDQS